MMPFVVGFLVGSDSSRSSTSSGTSALFSPLFGLLFADAGGIKSLLFGSPIVGLPRSAFCFF
jgi:hypothetical protein